MKSDNDKGFVRSRRFWIILGVAGTIFFLGDTFARLANETTWARVAIDAVVASAVFVGSAVSEAGLVGWIVVAACILIYLAYWGFLVFAVKEERHGLSPILPDSLRDHERSCIMDGLDARATLGAADMASAEGICVNCLQVETVCSCLPCDECGTMMASRPVLKPPAHMQKVFGFLAEPHGKTELLCHDCFFRNLPAHAERKPMQAKVI